MDAMRVGYDIRVLAMSPRPTGIGRYAASLIEHVSNLAEVVLFSDRTWRPPAELERLPLRVLPHLALWQQGSLPLALWYNKIDVFHGLAYTLPLQAPCKTVVTIHDMGFAHSPDTVAPDVLRYLLRMSPAAMRKANQIIVPSEMVWRDLGKAYPEYEAKAEVVRHGVSANFLAAGVANDQEVLRREIGEDRPYVLAVGTHEPRKNLRRLVEAFSVVVRAKQLPHRLVLLGATSTLTQDILSGLGGDMHGRIKILGYLPDETLVRYYQGASALAYPSVFEGFGFPILEAMATGCPVVTSANLAEVGGDAAVYVDPADASSIGRGIYSVLADESLRKILQHRGLEQARSSTWEQAARKTFAVYESALAAQEK